MNIIAAIILAAAILWGARKMSAALDHLTAEVTAIEGAADSAIALIASLAQQIRDNAGDPAQLQALADSLDAKSKQLADAVASNQLPTPSDQQPLSSASEPSV